MARDVIDRQRELRLLNMEAAGRAKSFDDGNSLPDVTGGGQVDRPDFALVFINPTIRNASTHSAWRGIRHPWIGTRPVWKVLKNGGVLKDSVFDEVAMRRVWDEEFAARIYTGVAMDRAYITNLVKWTGPNGDLPTVQMVRAFAALTRRELEIVQPRVVIAFGSMPFRALGGQSVRLGGILDIARTGSRIPNAFVFDTEIPMFPCYFPVGRGNPGGAETVLRAVVQQCKRDGWIA